MSTNPDEPSASTDDRKQKCCKESDDPNERLDAFYSMLRTRKYAIQNAHSNSPQWIRLTAILETEMRSWNRAYEAEEALIWLIDDGLLDIAFKALVVEALDNLSKEMVERRQKDFSDAGDSLSKRMAFQALAEDLHEHWATEDERLEYFRRITRNTALFLEGFLVCFVVSLAFLLAYNYFSPAEALRPSLLNLPLFLVVLASGAFGAGMSMLIGLNSRLEVASMPALEKMALNVNRWARSVVGAGGAVVLFSMCVAGLLEGKAMPALHEAGKPVDKMDAVTLAHLIVLCILAGFSEKFVPSKLNDQDK